MLILNPYQKLKAIRFYTILLSHLNKFFTINKRLFLFFQLIYSFKRRFRQLISLRSPKHFNIGKNQLYYIRTRLVFYKIFKKEFFLINNFTFNNFYFLFQFIPTATLITTHIKLDIEYKFTF